MARKPGVGGATDDPPAVAALAARLGHDFADPALLRQALTHRSAADASRQQLDSNERLEFLGDRVLGLIMAEWLSERFPQEREGALGKRLSLLVCAETLTEVGERIGLGSALRIPPAEGRTGLRNRATVLADGTEALIGALYVDGGLDAARRFIRAAWADALAPDAPPPLNAKSRLQEYLLGRGKPLPAYTLVSTAGPAHAPVFVMRVEAEGRAAEALGETRRASEQAAAEAWLAGIAP
ncbi:RNAse III [Humitalea rosea]|uniref:Ribonuclease 3 n=1 Tax=Humitalea rosea TaxID=990373 RepID=A0A2W7IN21_9PROT|nr:ribonuclease III [Humitalea rosea]PZW48706.1 RNAse III [Humitalea rosea]